MQSRRFSADLLLLTLLSLLAFCLPSAVRAQNEKATVAIAPAAPDTTRYMKDARGKEAVPAEVTEVILRELKLKNVEVNEATGAKIPLRSDKKTEPAPGSPRYLLALVMGGIMEKNTGGIRTGFGIRIGGKSQEMAVQVQFTDTQTGETILFEEKASGNGINLSGYANVRNGALSDMFQNVRPEGVTSSGDTSTTYINQSLKTPEGTLMRKASEKAIKKALDSIKK